MIDRIKKLSSIISFLLLTFALLAVANAPAKGYELSIYSSTPIIFWIAIIFGLLNGIFLIASNFYIKNDKMWIVGLFEVLFCNFLVISLYALRGYVLYQGRSDALTYVGLAKDVSNFGYIDNNFYPLIFVFISQLNQLTNISILSLSKYLPSFFYVFYVISVYCWSKEIIPDRRFVLSSLLASLPIFFAWFSTSIYPQILSIWMLPFLFYLLQKNADTRFRLFCIIILIIYPFFHPITGIVVLLYLTVFFISEKFNLSKKKKNVSKSLLLLSFVTLSAWFIQQYVILGSIKRVLFQLVGLFKYPTSSDYALYYVTRLGITTAVKILGLMIIDEIIFYLLSLYVIYQILLRKEFAFLNNFLKISMCFITGNLFLLIFFFSTKAHVLDRLINLNFNVVLTPPLVGYLIYKFFINNKSAKAVLVLSLIAFSAVTAIFSLYPSPITLRPNDQVTISDVIGMNWLITKKNLEIKTASISSPILRFADLIYGYNFRLQRMDLHDDWYPSAHFGFNDDDLFPIDEDRYFVITEYDMKPYIMDLWKDFDPTFEREDFIKINYCTNVDKIYENGELRSYLIYEMIDDG